MSNGSPKLRALVLSALMLVSVVAGSVAFAGTAAAATNTSIAPDDDTAGASNVTYTADGDVTLGNQDTLQYIDVHLGQAEVSNVGESDVQVYVDGGEYTDGLTEFSSSDGTVEFKLSNSQSVSDGDRVRVVVDDVTNPSEDFDANTTLHDTSDNQWQEYQDTVDIDTFPSITDYAVTNPTDRDVNVSFNSSEQLADISVDIVNAGGNTVKALSKSEFTETQRDGAYTYDGSTTLSEDGNYDVTLREAVDADGQDGADGQTESVDINVLQPSIVDGVADPAQVSPGTTVNNQEVVVTLTNVSADGDSDTHYVEFPDALASGLSVNSARVNGSASIAQSPNLVEGYDDDGTDETVRFQTDTDAGGTVDLNVTVDTSVDYPDTGATYDVDARVEDSDGDATEQTGVTSITAGETEAPIITDYAATNPADRNLSVAFNSSQELVNATVDVANSSGTSVATLTESDFSETNESGTWVYETTYTAASDGTYTATLTEAGNANNNDGADGESETVTVDSTPAAIVGGAANPGAVRAGETVSNQEVSVEVANVSQDSDTDWHYVEFPDALAGNVSVNSANANATSVTSSAELVDGYDDDGVTETVKFATSGDGGGDADLNLTVDASVTYPDGESEYEIDARVVDSGGDTSTVTNVTAISANNVPSIIDFAVTNPTDRDLNVRFNSSQELVNATVDVTDSSGTTVTTLTESDFSEANESGTWVYETTYTTASDGTYTATLTEADDADNNDGADGESETVTVDSTPASIAGGSASPDSVTPDETIHNQEVSVELSDVSADGDTDWHYVEFPDALAGNVSVNSADANATSITSSAELVDGYDDDGMTETVRFATSSDAGGEIDLNVSVDVSVAYPNTEATYAVDSKLLDSETGGVTRSDIATIDAVADESDDDDATTSSPTVTGFDLLADGQDVDIVVRTDAPVDQIDVAVSGPETVKLTRDDFNASQADGDSVYTADVTADVSGSFEAELLTLAADWNKATAGQTDTVRVPLPDRVESNSVASPSWTGDESVHTLEFPIATNASVTGETLRSVEIEYDDRFLNRSGSIGSVSDDQNVAAFQVVGPSGSIKSQLGGTDAVTVNVANDTVSLDLSDVDSSREPTLEAGDRIVVRLRPVTNPAEAGQYETAVNVETSAGSSVSQTSLLHVRSPSSVEARETAFVEPSDEAVSLELTGVEAVSSMTVDSAANASGVVSVTVPDTRPDAADALSGSVVTVLDISRPDAVENERAKITLTLSEDDIPASEDELALTRYDEESDSWVPLNTSVVSSADGAVTVEAFTSETSTFALTGAVDDSQSEQSTQDEQTTTYDTYSNSDESASTDSLTTDDPGSSLISPSQIGIVVVFALVALVGAVMVRRRLNE